MVVYTAACYDTGFWFVFSVGFRVKPNNDVPFVVWLTAGMTAWFVFADLISTAVNSVVASGNLVKKTMFPAEILPVISALTALFAHGVFLSILLGLIFTGLAFFPLLFASYLLPLLSIGVGCGNIVDSFSGECFCS